MLDSVAKHINHPALGDFALQSVQELLPPQIVFSQVQFFNDFGLGGFEEAQQLGQVYRVVAVVVGNSPATYPALSHSEATIRDSNPFSLVSVDTFCTY